MVGGVFGGSGGDLGVVLGGVTMTPKSGHFGPFRDSLHCQTTGLGRIHYQMTPSHLEFIIRTLAAGGPQKCHFGHVLKCAHLGFITFDWWPE